MCSRRFGLGARRRRNARVLLSLGCLADGATTPVLFSDERQVHIPLQVTLRDRCARALCIYPVFSTVSVGGKRVPMDHAANAAICARANYLPWGFDVLVPLHQLIQNQQQQRSRWMTYSVVLRYEDLDFGVHTLRMFPVSYKHLTSDGC